MNLAEEEIDQDGEGPEEDVVHPVVHGMALLVLGPFRRQMLVDFRFFRHGCGFRPWSRGMRGRYLDISYGWLP